MSMLSNLKKLRTNKGISQQKLAEIIGVSQQSINKYENHNVEPDIFTLISLAEYFNTSIDYLVGRFDNQELSNFRLKESEKEMIKKYRALNDSEKRCITTLITVYHGEKYK